MMASQKDYEWDIVIVTSRKAAALARQRFGVGVRVILAPAPVLGLHHGKRRLVEQHPGLIHASEFGISMPVSKRMMIWSLWASCKREELECFLPAASTDWPESSQYGRSDVCHTFNVNDFNSAIRGGGIGYYPFWMEDGYDLQVRRHLCLGGAVVCPRNSEVLGDMADLCSEANDIKNHDPVECAGNADVWASVICDLVRRA